MPRQARLVVPNGLYHVIARGNARQDIFRNRTDYELYLDRLVRLLDPMLVRLHAYCLMPNHVHLLLENLSGNLSKLMHRHHGWFASRMNWREGRVGHYFQGRFMSKRVHNDAYVMEVARYIHMNPVSAGMVRLPEDYPWSSFQDYLSRGSSRVTRTLIIGMHDGDTSRFYDFTVKKPNITSSEGGWPVAPWYSESDELLAPDKIPVDVAGIISTVCRKYGISETLIRSRRSGGEARAAAIWALRELTPLSLREIIIELRMTSVNAACNRIRWIRGLARKDSGVRERLVGIGLSPD